MEEERRFVQMGDGRYLAFVNYTLIFIREESLSDIEQTLVIHHPEIALLASSKREESHFLRRVQNRFLSHFLKLIKMLHQIRNVFFSKAILSSTHIKDPFDYRHIILLMTRSGRLHGFDTFEKQFRWSMNPGKGSFLGMSLFRSFEHIPAEILLLLKQENGSLHVLHIDPFTGTIVSSSMNHDNTVVALYPTPWIDPQHHHHVSVWLHYHGKVSDKFEMSLSS
jgi:hypothetical protein